MEGRFGVVFLRLGNRLLGCRNILSDVWIFTAMGLQHAATPPLNEDGGRTLLIYPV